MHATGPLVEDITVRYNIDAKASTFVVRVFSTGLLSAFAHDPKIAIHDFQGDVSFSTATGRPEGARLEMKINASSLEVVDDIPEKDRAEIRQRMVRDVLETDRFPEIVYSCPRISLSGTGDRYWAALNGELTLHGVTRALPLSTRVVVSGSSLRASGEFSIRQSEYEIAPVSAAAGTIRVKDELKFTFDILARKQE